MAKNRQPLDIYDEFPEGMINYLRHYGKHFNKKMYEFAVSKMYKVNRANGKKEKVAPVTKETFDSVMTKYGIVLDNDVMYDGVYSWMMGSCDYLGSSVPDEQHLALFVKDYVDDPDQADGHVFSRFFYDCVNNGEPVEWEEML